jgi:hypothetical protein
MKHYKLFLQHHIIFAIISLLFTQIINAQTATKPEGKGTAENPYQIQNLENLQWLSQTDSVWEAYFIQTDNINASATYNWDEDKGFFPIGASSPGFTGHYMGNNNIIDSLYINRPTSTGNIGLFYYTNDKAIIDSLILTNTQIRGKNSVGVLVGSNAGTITHCSSTGSVRGNEKVGGLVGNNRGTVKNSYSTCTVKGRDQTGGLIGYNGGITKKSFTNGTVQGDIYTGAISGSIGRDFHIDSCYSLSSVTGDSTVGGISGYNFEGVITHSYFAGKLNGNIDVGGISGFKYSSNGTVTNSFYNIETAGVDTSNGGTGLTTAAMQTDSTYINNGWDFICSDTNGTNDIWGRSDAANNGYPFLTWYRKWEKPIPQKDTLPDIIGTDSVTVTSIPLASDSCGGVIHAVTNDTLTYTDPGNYTITWVFSDDNGHIETQDQKVIVKKGEGIEHISEVGITIYPNPVHNTLHITSDAAEIHTITLSDITGRTVIHKTPCTTIENIDLSHLKTGIYFVRLQTQEGTVTTKIAKK